MNFESWKADISMMIEEFQTLDLGYPMGENVLFPPVNGNDFKLNNVCLSETASKAILSFYSICDGMSLPDVDGGIFFLRSRDLNAQKDEFFPIEIAEADFNLVILGSFGDGSYFGLKGPTGEVIKLPPSLIEKNVYHEVSVTPIRRLAESFEVFLVLISNKIQLAIEQASNFR